MQYTGLDLLHGALRNLGVIAPDENATADQVKTALFDLNTMLDSWLVDPLTKPLIGTLTGIEASQLPQPLTWPNGWYRAVMLNLSIEVAAGYQIVPTNDLISRAQTALATAKQLQVTGGKLTLDPIFSHCDYNGYTDECDD